MPLLLGGPREGEQKANRTTKEEEGRQESRFDGFRGGSFQRLRPEAGITLET